MESQIHVFLYCSLYFSVMEYSSRERNAHICIIVYTTSLELSCLVNILL